MGTTRSRTLWRVQMSRASSSASSSGSRVSTTSSAPDADDRRSRAATSTTWSTISIGVERSSSISAADTLAASGPAPQMTTRCTWPVERWASHETLSNERRSTMISSIETTSVHSQIAYVPERCPVAYAKPAMISVVRNRLETTAPSPGRWPPRRYRPARANTSSSTSETNGSSSASARQTRPQSTCERSTSSFTARPV